MLPVIYIWNQTVYTYGLMMVLGTTLAIVMSVSRATPETKNYVKEVLGICIFTAWLGAKLWHMALIADTPLFMGKGVSLDGCIAGILLTFVVYCGFRRSVSVYYLLDNFAPSLALCIGFIRLGCFLNGCCFGVEFDLPWAVQFPQGHATWPLHVHPTQLYEMLAMFLLSGLLLIFDKFKSREGITAAIFVMVAGFTHFGVEFLRVDHLTQIGGWLSWNQVGSLALGMVGLFLLLRLLLLGVKSEAASTAAEVVSC